MANTSKTLKSPNKITPTICGFTALTLLYSSFNVKKCQPTKDEHNFEFSQKSILYLFIFIKKITKTLLKYTTASRFAYVYYT